DLIAVGPHVAQCALESCNAPSGIDAHSVISFGSMITSIQWCSARTDQLQQQCALHMQTILGLINHSAPRTVEHISVDLHVAAHRQTVHRNTPTLTGGIHQLIGESPVAEPRAHLPLLVGAAKV